MNITERTHSTAEASILNCEVREMLKPTINELPSYSQMTNAFGGYNHNLQINSGQFYDEQNMTSDFYPIAASRRKRSVTAKLTSPQGLIAKDSLLYVDGEKIYYNGNAVEGITLSTLPENNPKKLISMGAYVCIFPDKKYINTADLTENGSMEMSFTSSGNIKISI